MACDLKTGGFWRVSEDQEDDDVVAGDDQCSTHEEFKGGSPGTRRSSPEMRKQRITAQKIHTKQKKNRKGVIRFGLNKDLPPEHQSGCFTVFKDIKDLNEINLNEWRNVIYRKGYKLQYG